MLLAFLVALIIITVIATFPSFWIRHLTTRIARSHDTNASDSKERPDT